MDASFIATIHTISRPALYHSTHHNSTNFSLINANCTKKRVEWKVNMEDSRKGIIIKFITLERNNSRRNTVYAKAKRRFFERQSRHDKTRKTTANEIVKQHKEIEKLTFVV